MASACVWSCYGVVHLFSPHSFANKAEPNWIMKHFLLANLKLLNDSTEARKHVEKLRHRIRTQNGRMFDPKHKLFSSPIFNHHRPQHKLSAVIHWYIFFPHIKARDFSFEFKLIEWHDIRVECFLFSCFLVRRGKIDFLCSEHDVARAKTWMINWEFLEWFGGFSALTRAFVWLFFLLGSCCLWDTCRFRDISPKPVSISSRYRDRSADFSFWISCIIK